MSIYSAYTCISHLYFVNFVFSSPNEYIAKKRRAQGFSQIFLSAPGDGAEWDGPGNGIWGVIHLPPTLYGPAGWIVMRRSGKYGSPFHQTACRVLGGLCCRCPASTGFSGGLGYKGRKIQATAANNTNWTNQDARMHRREPAAIPGNLFCRWENFRFTPANPAFFRLRGRLRNGDTPGRRGEGVVPSA